MQLQTEFEPIRELLKEEETTNSCMANLYYQLNELEDNIQYEDEYKFDLTVGKIIINLTKLAAINGVSIEYCVNTAYQKTIHPDGN